MKNKISKTLRMLDQDKINDFISRTIFKKPTISGKIVGFLKFVGELKQLVRKRSQKNN